MPIYEYKCKNCNKEFSIFFNSFNTGEVVCPSCGSKDIKKCISNIMRVKKGEEDDGSSSSCSSCSSNNCSTCGM